MTADRGTPRPWADLPALAARLRGEIVRMTTQAGSGHPSSSMSAIDAMVVLYFGGFLRYDPRMPAWPDRDRFILSKGHACPALYACLAEAGYFPPERLMTLRHLGSPLEGHPNMRRVPGVEASTGSLGQGLSLGVGHALAARFDGRSFRTWVMLGDGECQEGQVWEAAMTAAKYRLANLTAVVDYNKFQQSGAVAEINDLEPFADKWRAFGWEAREVDGHDFNALREAFAAASAERARPGVVLAHTVKGKGVSFVEADWTYHGRAIKPADEAKALEELRWR